MSPWTRTRPCSGPLRGGRDNFGIAIAIEIDLMPVSRLYGGGLFFDAEHAEDA